MYTRSVKKLSLFLLVQRWAFMPVTMSTVQVRELTRALHARLDLIINHGIRKELVKNSAINQLKIYFFLVNNTIFFVNLH